MLLGELIRQKETKAILFAESWDTNLFWLVILRRGLFAAAVGFKARSNSPSSGVTLVSVSVRVHIRATSFTNPGQLMQNKWLPFT